MLVYEGQILPPFMEDMEEYARCLDEIGKCNHILALDELSDTASNAADPTIPIGRKESQQLNNNNNEDTSQ